MQYRWRCSILMLGAILSCSPNALAEPAAADVVDLFMRRCIACHHADEPAGGLDLTSRPSILEGGDSGKVMVPGKPAESLLLLRIERGEMPPENAGKSAPLSEQEQRLVSRWIDSGASWPAGQVLDRFAITSDQRAGRDWWSFQPVIRPALPARESSRRTSNAIDRFIQSRLAAAELQMAPPADRRALVRRLYCDLLGIPPSSAQIESFVSDPRPDAYVRLVDRLLASPRYGERWSRYWLDVARFAETSGYERDQEKPYAWRYRDWVIDALNDDKPYDQFVVEQLAGDELQNRDESTVIATGFLRLGTWNDEPNDPQEYKYERLEDMVHAASSAFVGLTIKCARCHDHKFDPILQVDYYRLAAAFWAGPIEPRQRELLGGPAPEELGYDVLGWTDLRPVAAAFQLLKKGDPKRPAHEVHFDEFSVLPQLSIEPLASPNPRTTGRRLRLARWIVDEHNPLTSRVLVNRLWQHHFGEGLVRSVNNFGFRGDVPSHPQLLDWLASELIRSAWQIKPIHRLILTSQTYQQSSIHPRAAANLRRDAANRLWWHVPRRRLDAESLRDAMLLVSGELDLRMGGPSFRPAIAAEALVGLSRKSAAWQESPPSEQLRRSVYIFTQRSLLPPLLTTFDFCDTTLPCGRRDVTIVPTQALTLLNNAFVHQRSHRLAGRVASLAGPDRRQQVDHAWRLALSRAPTSRELQAAVRHLEQQQTHFSQQNDGQLAAKELALISLCHVLLNTNEFIYVD